MPDITKHLPLSALQPFFDNVQAGPATEAWRRQHFADLETIVHPAMAEFFKELRREGRLVTIPNSAGYSCPLWHAWNAAALVDLEGNFPDEVDRIMCKLASYMAHSVIFDIVYPYQKVLEAQDANALASFDKQARYLETTAAFNKGLLPLGTLDVARCSRTGLALVLRVDGWNPSGRCVVGQEVVDVPPAEKELLQETVVQLKTGNLLVADWFRIPEFNAVVQGKRFDLNSRAGCDARTRYFAETFGVFQFMVLGSPKIFQAGNILIGGDLDDDEHEVPDGYHEVGNVLTDMWSATFVEYETLLELVARNNPDAAQQTVDEYIAEHAGGRYGLHRIKVEPGTYYLYHFGESDEFAARAKEAGVRLEAGDVQPYFVISATRLVP